MTTMASNAFRMLKWLQHSPAKLAQRTTRKLDVSSPLQRSSPSDIPLFSLGNLSLSNGNQDSTCRVRPAPTPPRTQSPTPPLPPANRARPVPSRVHLPVNASWLHGQWATRQNAADAQREAQRQNSRVVAAIAEFERMVATQTPQAPTYPSSAPSPIKVKRRAPLPPVQDTPRTGPGKRPAPPPPPMADNSPPRSTHAPQRPVTPPPPPPAHLEPTFLRSSPVPAAVLSVKTAPPPPPLPPLQRQQVSPSMASTRPTSAPEGMNAVFAELLAKVPAKRSHSAPVITGESATVTNALLKRGGTPAKSQVYLKGSDLYPFHQQLQEKLSARPPAEEHVPSPEALRQAEAKRAQLALRSASHSHAGKWEPSDADRSLQRELKRVLAARRESAA